MASTVFATGTIIEVPWLNDVNNYVYGGGGGSGPGQAFETTATLGQTVFNLPFPYVVGSKRLAVYVNGIKQSSTSSYTETNSTTVTFTAAVPVTAKVEFNY